MKGEYVEHQQHHHHRNQQAPPPKHEPNNMFSKLHPHHQHLPFTQHLQLSRDSPTTTTTTTITDDDDTRTPATTTKSTEPITTTPTTTTNINTDGATIEVGRRPRGRPPGSKNKAKPPVIITREPEPVLSPYILEVAGGSDIVESLSRFCLRKNTGICVLSGTGAVANVTLRQPSTSPPGSTITFHGRFDILSISATVLPPSSSSTCPHIPNTFTISLAGPQGQIIGGLVAGGLIAAGTVYLISASFNNPRFHRLSAAGGGDHEEGRNSGSAAAGGSGGEGQSPGVSGAGGGESGHTAPGGESGIYSCHNLGSDVIWAPTARPPQAPY